MGQTPAIDLVVLASADEAPLRSAMLSHRLVRVHKLSTYTQVKKHGYPTAVCSLLGTEITHRFNADARRIHGNDNELDNASHISRLAHKAISMEPGRRDKQAFSQLVKMNRHRRRLPKPTVIPKKRFDFDLSKKAQSSTVSSTGKLPKLRSDLHHL